MPYKIGTALIYTVLLWVIGFVWGMLKVLARESGPIFESAQARLFVALFIGILISAALNDAAWCTRQRAQEAEHTRLPGEEHARVPRQGRPQQCDPAACSRWMRFLRTQCLPDMSPADRAAALATPEYRRMRSRAKLPVTLAALIFVALMLVARI